MAGLERRIKELKFHKELTECKNVRETLKTNPWMRDPIDEWPESKQNTFAKDFRLALEKELA